MQNILFFVAVYAMGQSFASLWRKIKGVLHVIIYL
jgi:hypothetical protein